MGVKLFERGSRKITLTNEGILLRRRAEEILQLVDKTEKEMSEQEKLVDGEISIGCGELASVHILAEIIKSFQKKYPLVRYDIHTANADHIRERLDKMNVKEKWVVLMRSDDPLAEKESITPEELSKLPVCLVRRPKVQALKAMIQL